MQQTYSWSWVETQVAHTIATWNDCAVPQTLHGRRYSTNEQQAQERAYDAGVRAVEGEARLAPQTKAERIEAQKRIIASFSRFSAIALGLKKEAVKLLTDDFLPAGVRFARCARQFDPGLSRADIIQACRNAWTACGLQPLFGERMAITPSILGYSLLYPYSDNFLDCEDVAVESKLRFSERFRIRLSGGNPSANNDREEALWALVTLIEEEYPRARYPEVFECLLAIHRAQEESIAQLRRCGSGDDIDVLRMSCAKGGSSVLADACLARGRLNEEERQFSFGWGVLLQLGDDLQDLREDLRRGSTTLFSSTAASGKPLDRLVIQLLNFSERVAARMNDLPTGTRVLKDLLRMSWRSLILGAVAEAHEFFSPDFVSESERCSPFRFQFLRKRHNRLTSNQGLYAMLFDILLETCEADGDVGAPEVMGLISEGSPG